MLSAEQKKSLLNLINLDQKIDLPTDEDILYFEHELTKTFPWYSDLSPIRQIVLIKITYMIGFKNLLSSQILLDALYRHNYHEVAEEILHIGKRVTDLAEIMISGKIPLWGSQAG